MAVTLTQNEINLVEKIQKGEQLEQGDLKNISALATKVNSDEKNSKCAEGIEALDAKLATVNKEKLPSEKLAVIPIDEKNKTQGLEANKELDKKQKDSLIAMLTQAMIAANVQLEARLAKKVGPVVTEKLQEGVVVSNTKPQPPTQVATSTGITANYTFDPKTAITGNKTLDFKGANFKFTNIKGETITDTAKIKEVQGLIEKTEQKVFDNFLKDNKYGSDDKGNITKEGKKVEGEALTKLQEAYSSYRNNDRLNEAAKDITKDTKYVLKFMDAPTPKPEEVSVEKLTAKQNYSPTSTYP